MGFSADGGTHSVCHPKDQSTSVFAISEGSQGVGRLSGLRDEEAGVVTENWSATIQKIWGKVNHNRHLCQFFQ